MSDRRVYRAAAATVLWLVASATSAGAHHSIAAVYDAARVVTVTGVVRAFRFVNPHPLLEVEAPDDAGRLRTWRLEMDNRFELVDIGMTADTFKAGDHVVVVGSQSRDTPFALYVRRLDRAADTLRYEQVGMRPVLVRGGR